MFQPKKFTTPNVPISYIDRLLWNQAQAALLSNFRSRARLTRAQLAALTGLTPSFLQKCENAKNATITMADLVKLCNCLDISIEDFGYG